MRNMFTTLVLAALAFAAMGCKSDGSIATNPNSIDPKTTFINACAYLGTADASFKAASPALVAAGKLTQTQLAQEAAIYNTAMATCANPPANLQLAAVQLVGDAASIYILITATPPEPKFLSPDEQGMAAGHAMYRLYELAH